MHMTYFAINHKHLSAVSSSKSRCIPRTYKIQHGTLVFQVNLFARPGDPEAGANMSEV